jgi:hypothetical protein
MDHMHTAFLDELQKIAASNYAQDFAAGIDPFGAWSSRYGQEAERSGVSEGKHRLKRGLGIAGGALGGSLAVPSAISAIVEAGSQASKGRGVKDRLLRGARGLVTGFKKPVGALINAGKTTKFLGAAAATKGGATAKGKQLKAIRGLLDEAPAGAVAEAVGKGKGGLNPEALKNLGQSLKSTGGKELHVPQELAQKLHGTAKSERAKFMTGLGLGGVVGAVGAGAQYGKGRQAEQGFQKRLEAQRA